jgi:hypothetical protein
MTPSPDPRPSSSDRQFSAVTGVEIKMTVRGDQEMKAVRLFRLDRGTAEERSIYFFDAKKLTLFDNGLILRARQLKDGADDSTVKMRPVDPGKVAHEWNLEDGFKLEADVIGPKIVRTASLGHPRKRGEIKDVAGGHRKIRELFSKRQEDFIETFVPIAVALGDLHVLGPIEALRWQFKVPKLQSEMTAEEWHIPDGTDLLELSIKVKPDEALKARDEFEKFLRDAGIANEGVQEAKTRVALKFFASQL